MLAICLKIWYNIKAIRMSVIRGVVPLYRGEAVWTLRG